MNNAAEQLQPVFDEVLPEAEAVKGVVHRLVSAGEPDLPYILYLPAGQPQPERVIVAVHGISRNVEEHLAAMRSWADEYATALVLPLYDKLDFHDYQRLGREGHGPRADMPLLRALDEVKQQFGIDTQRVALFGFSGGAQFAHRFALMYPKRVERLGLAAAGWYSWPDEQLPYPFGMGKVRGLAAAQTDLRGLLQIPMCVFVGKRDTERSRSLNTSLRIDAQQGGNRRERASNWVRAMREAGLARGIKPQIQLELLPRTKHAYRRAVTRGQMIARLYRCFYGE